MRDAQEKHSISFAAWKNGEAIGSLRLTLLRSVPDPQPLISKLCMHPALGTFGLDAICTTSRFMIDPRFRGGRIIYPLMKAVYEYGCDNGLRLNYGDCSPHQLPFYEHLGFQSYERGFNDPAYGYKLPILMLAGDPSGLRQNRSPLARLAEARPEDTEVLSWKSRIYGEEPPAQTFRALGRGGVQKLLGERLGRDPHASCNLLRGVSPDDIDLLLDESTFFRACAGDRITRRGEKASAIFLLVAGKASLGDAQSQTAVYPGGHFGQLAPQSELRATKTAIAETPCQLIAIPLTAFEKVRRHSPEAAKQLELNLTKLPSARDGKASREWGLRSAASVA